MNIDQVDDFHALVARPVPLGFWGMKAGVDRTARIPLDKRPVPFLFIGSAGDPADMRRTLRENSPFIADIVEAALEERGATAASTSVRALEVVFANRGLDSSRFGRSRIARLIESVDRIARVERRLRVVRAIRRAPLTIWGPGWPADIGLQPNITLLTEGYPTGLDAVSRATLMLNIFPDEFSTYHDRVALAVQAGTPVLSEFADRFHEWVVKHGAAFDFRTPGEIDSMALALLTDMPRLRASVAAADACEDAAPATMATDALLGLYEKILLMDAIRD
jgi:hypothetical protein